MSRLITIVRRLIEARRAQSADPTSAAAATQFAAAWYAAVNARGGDARGLERVANEWAAKPARVRPVVERCRECGLQCTALNACGLCQACAAADAAADALCVAELRKLVAAKGLHTPSEVTLRRQKRDAEERQAAVMMAAMLARAGIVPSRGAA